MEGNPYAAPASRPSQDDQVGAPRIRPVWRWCLALVSLFGMVLAYEAAAIRRAIGMYYFKDPGSIATTGEIALALVCAYLLLVSASGRWRLDFRA